MSPPDPRPVEPPSSSSRRRGDAEHGFTLVELLVVMTLLLVVVGLGTDAMIAYVVDVRRHQERVDALHELQLSAATVSRELRAADPVESFTAVACDSSRFPGSPAPVNSCANDLTVQVRRGTAVRQLRYALVPDPTGTRMDLTTRTWQGSTWGPATTSTVVRGLSNDTSPSVPLFALADLTGAPAASTSATARLRLSLVRRVDVPGQPQVRLDAQVAVRSAVYRRARS